MEYSNELHFNWNSGWDRKDRTAGSSTSTSGRAEPRLAAPLAVRNTREAGGSLDRIPGSSTCAAALAQSITAKICHSLKASNSNETRRRKCLFLK
jgi:hypothetical protein